MLQFFRKYQKIVFFFVTVVVVISFCFFGTYGTLSSRDQKGDKEIGMGMMGKPLFAKEYRALSLLLSSSIWDRGSREGALNFLNPGVIERDFLATGIGAMLVKPYFGKMKAELDLKAKKIQAYRPYVHPHSADLGLENLFTFFSPSFAPTYFQLKARSDQATMETWMLLSQLYLEQATLPSTEMIRQFLLMQENQMGLIHDELLPHADLSFFGFKTMEDWLGPQFLSLVTNTILQVAQLAEMQGYEIPNEEVRAELFSSIKLGYEKVLRKKEVSQEDIQKYYVGKMHSLGLDEETLLSSWRKVMLFERVFNEVGGSVYLDPLAINQFEEFVEEKRSVEMYTLPSSLQFKDFLSLCKFQLYLESISPEGFAFRKTLDLPRTFYTIDQMEKKSPQLIAQQIQVEWRSVSMNDLKARISLQETLHWQDSHWGKLEQQFPKIREKKGIDRFEILASLLPEERKEIDRFTQEQIIREDRERISSALAAKPFSKLNGNLSRDSALFSRLDLHNEEILKLLQDASLSKEESNEASRLLQLYSSDQQKFYEIVVLERSPVREIMTFSQALQEGIVDRMLSDYLEKMYPEVRKKNLATFQTKEGKVKPVNQVQLEIARHLFADLVQTISNTNAYREAKDQTDPLQLCASVCLFGQVDRVYDRWSRGETDSLSFYPEESHPCVIDLTLEKKVETVTRSAPIHFDREDLFTENLLQWSSVKKGARGLIGFYRVLEVQGKEGVPFNEIAQGHQILGEDAKRNLMANLLKKIHETNHIDLLVYAD